MRDDFAVFIMVWGRPDKVITLRSLNKHGYTGKVYLVADDLDNTLDGYKEKYSDNLLVFNKTELYEWFDAGDNSGDLRSTLYAANIIPRFAAELGIKYFCIFCDDYTAFHYKIDGEYKYIDKAVLNLDKVFGYLLDYYKSIPATSIAIAQGGDYITAKDNDIHKSLGRRRKVMNTFFCSIERPFEFLGRMNEDVTTYINLGNKGNLFLTFPLLAICQPATQSQKGGLTDLYIDYGTYIKSFFSIIYNPSNTKIGIMGDKELRLHHKISWKNAVPCIIREDYRKASINT